MDQELHRFYESLSVLSDFRTNFTTPRIEETNHLEFKEKSDRRNANLSGSDKKNLSKALSAFSNADGGLLVWGISTRKRNNRDTASTLKPIRKASAFAEALRDSLLDSAIPRNHKVRIKAITNRLDNGFVICMIPTAEDVPVRAMNADREYWIRADGRTMKLEHYQIKDMMLRHAHPNLEFEIFTSDQDLPPDQISIGFRLHNTGKALAKFWGYFIQMPTISIIRLEECRNLSAINAGMTTLAHDGGFNSVIHPNNIKMNAGGIIIQRFPARRNIEIAAKWYCEDMTPKENLFVLSIPPAVRNESDSDEHHNTNR